MPGKKDPKLEDLSKDDLYELATELDVDGRSTMDKDQLVVAIKAAQSAESGKSMTASRIAPFDKPARRR